LAESYILLKLVHVTVRDVVIQQDY